MINKNFDIIQADTVVLGSGASGYNAALQLKKNGRSPIIVTEGINMGTSRNTGSDKQTYYKLGLSGSTPDSPLDMCSDIFSGGCTDGDIAYAEAASSVKCFMQLAELGVPFPINRLGEYVGYKTDHDKRMRATSAGPLTSKLMTECLEKAVREAHVPIYDGYVAIKIVKNEKGQPLALLTLDENNSSRPCFFLFSALILATGGPAGMYKDSVFPESQNGAASLALKAGATGKNLTEWQYGLASVSPRWNVSGTYMQTLPRIVSIDKNGKEKEFIADYFKDDAKYLSLLFKKGYEWPFDANKAKHGSSVIDLLVWYEISIKKNRVFLDYTKNPCSYVTIPYDKLSEEAHSYLKNAGACLDTPIDRLLHMNAPAYELYLSKGVDLKKDMLEIALCAQHSNGGISTDIWWKSDLDNVFVVGEAAGTHGIKRPGGSALNAGQVGSLRAALYIAQKIPFIKQSHDFSDPILKCEITELENNISRIVSDTDNVEQLRNRYTTAMSACGAAVRDIARISELKNELYDVLSNFFGIIKIPTVKRLGAVYRLYDSLYSQFVSLCSMLDFEKNGGASRGSAIYLNKITNESSLFDFSYSDPLLETKIQCVSCNALNVSCSYRDVRPIPSGGGVFENVWREYRNGDIFN